MTTPTAPCSIQVVYQCLPYAIVRLISGPESHLPMKWVVSALVSVTFSPSLVKKLISSLFPTPRGQNTEGSTGTSPHEKPYFFEIRRVSKGTQCRGCHCGLCSAAYQQPTTTLIRTQLSPFWGEGHGCEHCSSQYPLSKSFMPSTIHA